MKSWIMAIRPKTLSASIAPVILGLSFSHATGVELNIIVALVTLLCALFLQISSNLINDYYDGIKGTDDKDRLGPTRVTSEGIIPAPKVKKAFIGTLLLSLFLGIYLIFIGGLPIFIIAMSSLFFSYAYTGGPYPLSYYGLGEVFAFLFFGPVAVWGTCFLQSGNLADTLPLILGLGPGFISATLMSVNNLRDIESDRRSSKTTLASYFGKDFARILIIILVISSTFIPIVILNFIPGKPLMLIASFSCYLFLKTWKNIIVGPIDAGLNIALASTGKYMALYCLLFSIGLVFEV